ncbi:DUF2235 domain-containing protein [Actibacterium sp.]|uniref:DUF2235 domain-containing protein n=1 Tax=Actibacterium sp. TaxID=1872125 RepID=UPI0035680651
MGIFDRVRAWLRREHEPQTHSPVLGRKAVTHIVILDGTLSSLDPGEETNAGLAYKLLSQAPGANLSLYYESGIQWDSWRQSIDVIMGRGINRQIRRAYGYLASRYHPGDRIILMGYSRGAFAVRSLAGVLDRVGLLKSVHATERNVRQAYRHYETGAASDVARAFSRAYCYDHTEVEMVGVWDTVKALGLRLPLLWRLTEPRYDFHNHELGKVVKHGFHALALDESREVFTPVLWQCPSHFDGRVEQVWFRGSHGDIGGQLSGFEEARPLANIPLVWMLRRLESCDVRLPEGWMAQFPCDANAPSVGSLRGWGKFFLIRHKRVVGRDSSESIHPTAINRAHPSSLPVYQPSQATAPNDGSMATPSA